MRVAFQTRLIEGHEAKYEVDHARIPDDLAAAFARVGVREWLIWRDGLSLFHFVECDDFAAAMAALENDPANLKWQTFIGIHVDASTKGAAPMLAPLWSLAEQRA